MSSDPGQQWGGPPPAGVAAALGAVPSPFAALPVSELRGRPYVSGAVRAIRCDRASPQQSFFLLPRDPGEACPAADMLVGRPPPAARGDAVLVSRRPGGSLPTSSRSSPALSSSAMASAGLPLAPRHPEHATPLDTTSTTTPSLSASSCGVLLARALVGVGEDQSSPPSPPTSSTSDVAVISAHAGPWSALGWNLPSLFAAHSWPRRCRHFFVVLSSTTRCQVFTFPAAGRGGVLGGTIHAGPRRWFSPWRCCWG